MVASLLMLLVHANAILWKAWPYQGQASILPLSGTYIHCEGGAFDRPSECIMQVKKGETRPPKLKTEDPNKSYVQRPVKRGWLTSSTSVTWIFRTLNEFPRRLFVLKRYGASSSSPRERGLYVGLVHVLGVDWRGSLWLCLKRMNLLVCL